MRTIGDWSAPRRAVDRRLCIMNYHRILGSPDLLLEPEPDVATFRWQMELLADCFNVMPLYDAVHALGTERMPARALAITFDDGYRSIHDWALPILKEFGLPATVFVTTGYMEDEGSMWNDVIVEAIRRLPGTALDLSAIGLGVYSMGSAEDRKLALRNLTERSKYLPPCARLELTRTLQSLAGHTLQEELMLTSAMVRTLSSNNVEIGGHTVTHPILTRINNAAARTEIEENKQQLEAITGKPVRLFAYPNGKTDVDFDQRHVQMVSDAGYTAAFTTAAGAATRHHDRFALPRSRPWDTSPLLFAARLLLWLRGRNT
ncbi:MAG: polysaccharide deacetylase family protein [Massilia sp.]|nr:polysaccharide deacetylase family protein [Massilia sp.]